MDWLGLDVGGANLKVAHCEGYARSLPFPLWKQPRELSLAIHEVLRAAPPAEAIAVTMTGELADCFETKIQGVLHILDAVEQAAESHLIAVYLVDGRLVTPSMAREQPSLAAASNWHALGRFVCRLIDDFPAILLDVGSTTTDIIPIHEFALATHSKTDTDRLLAGELVYTGINRTPLASITSVLPFRGKLCPVAAELFATSADAAVLLGYLPEQSEDFNTADGRPLTRLCSRNRLARMFCADRDLFNDRDALEAASYVWNCQVERIAASLQKVLDTLPSLPASILIGGSGEKLGEAAARFARIDAPLLRLSDILGTHLSIVAPAHAVAVLASEGNEEL